MTAKLETDDDKAFYKKRKQAVEPVFGIIESAIGFRRFSLRGIGKAATGWTLVTLAYNCKRMATLRTARFVPTNQVSAPKGDIRHLPIHQSDRLLVGFWGRLIQCAGQHAGTCSVLETATRRGLGAF